MAESLGYRGQATDPIGTVHFGLREYDPSVGRWLSADPLGHDGSLSLYDYCDNDPVNRFDPDGRFGKQATARSNMLAVRSADNYRATYGPSYASSFKGYADPNWKPYMTAGEQLSTALNYMPVVNVFKSGVEAVTGYDFLGDRYLSNTERGFALASTLVRAGSLGTGSVSRGIATTVARVETKMSVNLTKSTPLVPGLCFVEGTEIATDEGGEAIELLKVGDRVLTTDNNSSTSVDSATWRKVTLKMPNPECPSDILNLDLLRPLEWIAQTGSRPGGQIWFELEEMGLKGWAEVEKVETCPPVKAGHGRVVLMTVTHENSFLMELKFEGGGESLKPTGRHRLFSVTRNDWVPTVQLLPGEELRTSDGIVRIASITPVPGTPRVYNIEVETEHSYFAGAAKVLSHNANGCAAPLAAEVPMIHKNSFNYIGDTHVYRIKGPDGSTFKIGESARGVRASDGLFIRAEEQVRRLQRETGDTYSSQIRKTFGTKAEARDYERRLIERFRRMYGEDALPGNKSNH